MNLERVLEPEVMDSAEEATDYNQMDHGQVNRQFVDDLFETGDVSGDILDLGTATALIPIEICRRTEDVRIMAVDMAVAMLELARYNIEVDSCTQQIQLDHADAKSLPYADEMFQLVMSNSIVHHIPEPLGVLREAVRVTASGGRLFFRDLMRPESDEQLHQLVATYAGQENERQRKMFAESLHAALTVQEMRNLVQSLGFSGDTVQATSDRHWTWRACVSR